MAPFSAAQAFDMAWKHYQAGRLQQAEQLCRQIVQADASHVDALHLLGLIAARTGRDDLAVDYLKAALRLKPDFADGAQHPGHRAGQAAEAGGGRGQLPSGGALPGRTMPWRTATWAMP